MKMAPTKLYNDNDTDLQQRHDEALLQSPELPPRNASGGHANAPYVDNQNVFRVLLKNRRQISSLTAGLILLLGSGVHIVWAFWEVYGNNSWHDKSILVMVGSWYVAAVIGGACGACLVTKWTKRKIYILAGIILLISSLLFVCRWYNDLRLDTLVMLGRSLAGFTYGLTYLTVIVHAADNAVNQIRGVILRGVGYVLSFALFVAGFTTNGTVENDIYSEIYMGCINLLYSVLALILIPVLTIESAPFIYQHYQNQIPDENEKLVIATMVHLRNETQETAKIRYDFDEMKRQWSEDQSANQNIFNPSNLRPLLVVTGVRVLSVCAKNLPLTVLVMGFSNSLVNPENYSLYTLLLLLTFRFVFGMFAMFFIDKFEWKRYLYIFTILSGIYLLVLCLVAIAIDVNMFALNYYGCGVIIFFVLGSMGIDCIGHVQTSEAFSYATKPWSIMFATSVEHLVHMLFIVIFKLKYDIPSFILMAIGLIVLGVGSLLNVPPKTKGLSLRQTRDIYRRTVQVVRPSV